jgi:zinc protease
MSRPGALLALLLALFTALVRAASPWPAAESDLPPQPGLRQGTLPNGLRYAILPNAEPRDRISLRLVVAVGSLHEADDERGLAHFVEHMAFRGTRTHPAGSLTDSLQRLGLGLGPDSAAFTFFDHTIYHLELPDAKTATLREGLRVFREYASEVSFEAGLIERERGVILSEKSTRDTAQARVAEANLAFLFPDSPQARRSIIGTTASIRALTRPQFLAFYDAWYRPERMAVIIVGTVEPDEVIPLVEAELSGLTARGAARPEPALAPASAAPPNLQIHSDPGLVGVSLTFEHPIARGHSADTHAERVRALHEGLAFGMFNQRLNRLALDPDASFVTPSARLGGFVRDWVTATIGVSCKIVDWQRVAADIEREHRRAYLHGFSASELKEAKVGFANHYEQAVRSAPTWPSDWLARRLADSVLYGFVLVPPAAQQADLAADLASATLEDCQKIFRETWAKAAPHVHIAAHPSFNITVGQIAAALNKSRERPAPPPEEFTVPEFAYTDFGPPGQLVRDETVSDLDVRLTQFANGVRANFKSTTFAADTVEIRIRVGEGKLLLPPAQPGLDVAAGSLFLAGGLSRHSLQDLSRILSVHSIGYSFDVGSDACLFYGRCPRRDLVFCLQLFAAYFTDAAYRPEALRSAAPRFGSMYSSLAGSPGGPIAYQAFRVLFGGDRRFGSPFPAELSARSIAEVSAWLEPQLKKGAVELSVVGDVSWDEAREALSRTFGALPPRGPRADTTKAGKLGFAKPSSTPIKYYVDPKLGRAAVACYWPMPDLKDIHAERRCRLLARVLADRLRVRLRDELGAAYAPTAGFTTTEGFPRLSYFSVYAELEPSHLQQGIKLIQREVAALSADGVTAEEFTRAHQPYLHDMSDDRRTNAYWGATVLLDAQSVPYRLDAARDRNADTAAITASELSVYAKRYLTSKNVFTFTTVPPSTVREPPALLR